MSFVRPHPRAALTARNYRHAAKNFRHVCQYLATSANNFRIPTPDNVHPEAGREPGERGLGPGMPPSRICKLCKPPAPRAPRKTRGIHPRRNALGAGSVNTPEPMAARKTRPQAKAAQQTCPRIPSPVGGKG